MDLVTETTIERAVAAQGVGLHSGVKVGIRLCPAPAGRGVVFVRKDLDDFRIPADGRFVARVSYATSLMRKGVLLSTTEHLLSVFYSMGIDNVRVEIDNLEVPILDGSGLPFVRLIEQAGVKSLRRRRQYLKVLRRVEIRDGGKRLAVEPADCFRVTCCTDFGHPLAGPQKVDLVVTPASYAKQIAPARTFGFERDLAKMRDMGLIRGASLENAVCFGDNEILNAGGLRFDDECCRHKVLDLIGDLALLGRPLLGHIIADRAGHAMHTALVRKILSDPGCYRLGHWEDLAAEPAHAAAV